MSYIKSEKKHSVAKCPASIQVRFASSMFKALSSGFGMFAKKQISSKNY